jgi:hypothetical protein
MSCLHLQFVLYLDYTSKALKNQYIYKKMSENINMNTKILAKKSSILQKNQRKMTWLTQYLGESCLLGMA